MSANEDIVREVYAAAEAESRDTDKFVSLFADDGYFLDVPSGKRWYGPDIREAIKGISSAFPDMHRELLEFHATGDVVVVELKLQGTHQGDWHVADGILPATGKAFDVPCCDVFRLRDSKVVAFHCYNEASVWLDQLGALRSLDAVLRR